MSLPVKSSARTALTPMTPSCSMRWRRVKYAPICLQFRHVLEDIQTLNQKARAGEYELTAISYHAYPYVADKYVLMAAGSSIGDGYGPMVVASIPWPLEELKGKRIAIPGRLTTAYLTLKLMEPDFEAVVILSTRFSRPSRMARPMPAWSFTKPSSPTPRPASTMWSTWAAGGRTLMIFLCRWAPMPCGAISSGIASECCRLMRESIQYALDHREEALNYALSLPATWTPAGGKIRGHVRQPLHCGLRGYRAQGRAKAARYGI